ncbi:MAG: glutathione S-transferase family protein [Mariprofundaceae bacterium]|nr:glutathione S-transferase family protein [Mariprofundaceae bacterium]
MGLLVDGIWHDQWYDTASTGGKFERKASQFLNHISVGGDFPPEAGRYHLYVSLACPWAHRTLIFRKFKGLESLIEVTVMSPDMLASGWQFDVPEPLYGFEYAHQLYTLADAHYSGRVTVPILWDKQKKTIVSNESAEIIRMFNTAFDALTGNTKDFYPEELRSDIDDTNDFVYTNINNGVYRCGFATTQQAYDEAFDRLFSALDTLEKRLSQQRYLVGHRLTEADWRLFTTLIRFDAVYVGHFKCNRQRIADYPNLSHYLRELYQYDYVRETVNMGHIKQHYYGSHESINPTRIVPKGPSLDFNAPHDRIEKFGY